MILNSMLQNSPVALVVLTVVVSAAYALGRAAQAVSRHLRAGTPRR